MLVYLLGRSLVCCLCCLLLVVALGFGLLFYCWFDCLIAYVLRLRGCFVGIGCVVGLRGGFAGLLSILVEVSCVVVLY